MKNLFTAMKEELEQGRPVVLCSILASSGSTPRGAGAKMAVFTDGRALGTIGGGNVENLAILEAREILKSGEERIRGFCLAPNQVADIGMICGGAVTVYYRRFLPERAEDRQLLTHILTLLDGDEDAWLELRLEDGRIASYRAYARHELPEDARNADGMTRFTSRAVYNKEYYVEPIVKRGMVYVFGAGHVGRALVPVLSRVGFRVTVVDSRENLAKKEFFPDAVRVICAKFEEISNILTLEQNDYAVIMTPGHEADYTVLRQVLRTKATYIGCIGSRKKIGRTNERLYAEGFTPADAARVHAPIGLAIGAETPEEIAISIAAEMIAHRAGFPVEKPHVQ